MLTDFHCSDNGLTGFWWLKQEHWGYVSYSRHLTRAEAFASAYEDKFAVYCSDTAPVDAVTVANHPYIFASYSEDEDDLGRVREVFCYDKKSEATDAYADALAEGKLCQGVSGSLAVGGERQDDFPAHSFWVVECVGAGKLVDKVYVHGDFELAFGELTRMACVHKSDKTTLYWRDDSCPGLPWLTAERFIPTEDGCILCL